jgi:hypothetical protein
LNSAHRDRTASCNIGQRRAGRFRGHPLTEGRRWVNALSVTGFSWVIGPAIGKYVVSRPENFTPAPLRTVREILTSHGSHQTNRPLNSTARPLIALNVILSPVCRTYDCLTRSLRSSAITVLSSLLQTRPPQTIASVLSPRGFLPLCFSLSIDGLVPAVPHKKPVPDSRPLYPGCRPPSHQASNGLVPGDMITPGFDST